MSTKALVQYKWLHITGRIFLIIWAGFWLFFAIASSIGEHSIGDILVVSVLILIPCVIAWFWEQVGGILLIAIGVIILFGYFIFMTSFPIPSRMLNDLLLSFCPLTSGILFTIRGVKMRKQNESQALSQNV
jgi:hypothetical protein